MWATGGVEAMEVGGGGAELLLKCLPPGLRKPARGNAEIALGVLSGGYFMPRGEDVSNVLGE